MTYGTRVFCSTLCLCAVAGVLALLVWNPPTSNPRAIAEGELFFYAFFVVSMGLFYWLPATVTVIAVTAIVFGWRKNRRSSIEGREHPESEC